MFPLELLNADTSRDTCYLSNHLETAHGESKGQHSLSHQDDFSEVKAGVLATGRACEWDLGNSLGEWLKGFGLDGRNSPMSESEKNISEEWRK